VSIHREFNIYCDRCEEMQGDACIPERDGTPTDLRKVLKKHGWVRVGREDFCAVCAPVELDERA
jgi:hypothetical protein